MDTDGQSFSKVCMVNILSYKVNKLNGIFSAMLHTSPSLRNNVTHYFTLNIKNIAEKC